MPPRLDDAPEFALAVGESLGTLARLAGYTLADTSAGTTDPLEVTLVWQAGAGAAQGRYTVFVNLLNNQGQIIARSDSITARERDPRAAGTQANISLTGMNCVSTLWHSLDRRV